MRTLSLSTALGMLLSTITFAQSPDSKKLDAEVNAITKSAILIDTHNDIPSFTIDGADIGNSPKNYTDIPRLRAGGVGAIFFSVYVDAKYVHDNHSANRALQMIDTVYTDIIGRYPIGIGTDFDGIPCAPVGLDDVSKFPNLTRALLEKGYSAADIKKIYGGNTLRVMRQVEKVAATMKIQSPGTEHN